jgi:hypothetical protein
VKVPPFRIEDIVEAPYATSPDKSNQIKKEVHRKPEKNEAPGGPRILSKVLGSTRRPNTRHSSQPITATVTAKYDILKEKRKNGVPNRSTESALYISARYQCDQPSLIQKRRCTYISAALASVDQIRNCGFVFPSRLQIDSF